jgi:multicomponent Na+:H+ antiporter subunit E
MSLPQPQTPTDKARRWVIARATAWRAAMFLAFWFVLAGIGPAELTLAGPLAIVAATWMSLRLLPPSGRRGSLFAMGQLSLRFLRQTVIAGLDVAWRALHPNLPLHPGLITHPVRFPPGPARNMFCMLTCLVPGTMPVGEDESGALIIHCLDVGQPVAAQLEAEEALLARVLGSERHG